MDAIERLYADDPYFHAGAEAVAAWQRIDDGAATGNTELVAEGDRDLLFREQRNVIDDDYRAMSARPVTGEVFTYVFTAVGAPSIPGAESFSEVFPINAEVRGGTDDGFFGPIRDALLPVEAEVAVGTATPLPDGNVANFDDRWALIEQDTLPAYVDLVENHPEQAAEILSTPVADRVEEWRIVHRIDDIATNWEPYVDVEVRPDGSVFSVIGDGAALSPCGTGRPGGGAAWPRRWKCQRARPPPPTTPTPTTVPPPPSPTRPRNRARSQVRQLGRSPADDLPHVCRPAGGASPWRRPPCSLAGTSNDDDSGGDDMTELRWDLRQPTTTREPLDSDEVIPLPRPAWSSPIPRSRSPTSRCTTSTSTRWTDCGPSSSGSSATGGSRPRTARRSARSSPMPSRGWRLLVATRCRSTGG